MTRRRVENSEVGPARGGTKAEEDREEIADPRAGQDDARRERPELRAGPIQRL